jgi:PAS domain S-box-containing protein
MADYLWVLTTVLYATGAALFLLSGVVLWKASRRVAVSFGLLSFLIGLWAFAYAIEIAASTLSTKLALAKAEYLGIATVPTLWLVFVLQYTGYRAKPSKRLLFLLSLEPVATLLLTWTNQFHHMIYAKASLKSASGLLLLKVVHGPWFWFHVVYSYLLMTVAAAVMWDYYRHSGGVGKKRALVLLIASVIPWAGDYFLAQVLHQTYIDFTPIFLLLGSLITAFGIFKWRMLDLVPVARNVAIEGMSDAYMVVDTEFRILDLNPTAAKAFGKPRNALLGRRFFEFSPVPIPEERMRQRLLPYVHVVKIGPRFLEIKGQEIKGGEGETIGILATWRDVTERVRQERLLEEKVSQLRTLNEVVRVINEASSLEDIFSGAVKGISHALVVEKLAILLLDEEKVMRFVAWHGLSNEYRKAVEGHSPWPPDAVNPKPVLVEDIEKADDPELVHLRDVILREGIMAGDYPDLWKERALLL